MTKEQAFKVLDSIIAQVSMNRADRQTAEEALQILSKEEKAK